jgi:DNA repair exonuclease SbcCD ATPase subunit
MVRGTQDILEWFSNSNMPYWRIYSHKGIVSGNVIMQSAQLENQSHGDALSDLRAKLKVLNRGTFTAVAFPEPNRLPTKGYWHTDIEITQGDALAPAAINGPALFPETDIQKRIDDAVGIALNRYRTEQELTELKKKNAELEKEKKELEKSVNEPWNKVISGLAPYSEKIIAGIFPQAAVAGIPTPDAGPEENDLQDAEVIETEATELTMEQQEVLSDFVTALAANDQDWVNTLKRLTKAITEKPTMIGMVKNFI